MSVPDLFGFASAHAHRGDPGTSFAAASAAGSLAAGHCAQIHSALSQHALGLTFHEIADLTGLDYHAVGRRVCDLRKAGLAVDSGARRVNPSGRRAAVWRMSA